MPPYAIRHPASEPAAREHRALDEQLPDDAAAAGADRRANRDFALADRRARQQHIGDVAAGDDEQEADRAEERIERAAELAHHPVDDGNDAEAEAGRVVVRPLGGAPRADHVQLRFGFGGGHTGAEVGLERTRPARCLRIVAALHRRRQPQIGDVPLEARRHHPDDSVGLAVQHQRAADHARIGTEACHPGAVVHDGDRRRAGRHVAIVEHAADERRYAEKVEAVRRHPVERQALGAGVAHPVRAELARADDVLERGGLLLIVEELLGAEIRAADDAAGAVAQDDVDEAIGAGIRKRIQRDVAQHAVDDRDGADPEGEREDGDEREAGRPQQRADAVGHVAAKILEPHERARVAGQFLRHAAPSPFIRAQVVDDDGHAPPA